MKKLIYLIVAIAILGLIVSGCIPVVPPSEQDEPGTLPNKTPGDLYVPGDSSTIQGAIDAASPGDTINVAAGIYDEQIVIDKNLTLQGAGGDTTIIQPSGASILTTVKTTPWIGTSNKQMAAIVFVDTFGAQVTIKDLKIDGSLIATLPPGIGSNEWVTGLAYLETSGSVERVAVEGYPQLGTRACGIWTSAVADAALVEVTGCSVIGYNRGSIYACGGALTVDFNHNEIYGPGEIVAQVPNGMFFLRGATGSATYNTITDLAYTGEVYRSTGIGTYRPGPNLIFGYNEIYNVQNAFAIAGGSGATIEYNDIHECHTGVKLEAIGDDYARNVMIQYNDIKDNDFAIRCGGDMGDGNEAHYNNFVGNLGTEWIWSGDTWIGAVCNIHETYMLDAINNWWGHASGPGGEFGRTNPAGKIIGKGDTVSDNVNWDPWLSQPTVPPTQILNKWDLEGTFVAKVGYNWGIPVTDPVEETTWEYSIHIKEAIGGEFSVGSIHFSTGGAEVTGIVEQTKNDYDYWFGNAGHPPIPNLAAAGRVEYDGVMYNFMFLLNEQAMWFALSDSELEPYWTQEIVWPSGLRIYQLHSTVYMGQFNMEPK